MSEPLPATLTALWEGGGILDQIYLERNAQDVKWGPQSHPDGTNHAWKTEAGDVREACQLAFELGVGTWRHILDEEICEAFAETDPVKLRVELVQCAAVICAWIQDIDSR